MYPRHGSFRGWVDLTSTKHVHRSLTIRFHSLASIRARILYKLAERPLCGTADVCPIPRCHCWGFEKTFFVIQQSLLYCVDNCETASTFLTGGGFHLPVSASACGE